MLSDQTNNHSVISVFNFRHEKTLDELALLSSVEKVKVNKAGEITPPGGAPMLVITGVKKDSTHLKSLLFTYKCNSLCIKICGLMVLNADEMSINM